VEVLRVPEASIYFDVERESTGTCNRRHRTANTPKGAGAPAEASLGVHNDRDWNFGPPKKCRVPRSSWNGQPFSLFRGRRPSAIDLPETFWPKSALLIKSDPCLMSFSGLAASVSDQLRHCKPGRVQRDPVGKLRDEPW